MKIKTYMRIVTKMTMPTTKPRWMRTIKLKIIIERTLLRLKMRVKTTKMIPKKYILMTVMRKSKTRN